MSVTPLTAEGRVRFLYTSAGLPHEQRVYIDFASGSPVVGTEPTIAAWSGSASDVQVSDFADAYAALMKKIFRSTDSIDSFVCEVRSSGSNYDPVWTGTLGVAGTSSGNNASGAVELIITIRALDFQVMRFTFLGVASDLLTRYSTIGSHDWSDLTTSLLLRSGFDVGNYVRSRNQSAPLTFMKATIQTSNHIENQLLG